MTLWLVLVLVALAAGAFAGVFLHADAGYVLVSLGPWVLETSVLGFVGLAIAALLLLTYGGRLLLAGLRLPRLLRDALAARRERRARESFESGLQHLLEGDGKRAEVELVRRAADHPSATLNYLFAARAAQRAGAPQRRDHYLELAARQGEPAAFAARLARAELQLQRGEHAAAKLELQQLYAASSSHPYVIELLASAYRRGGEWEPLRLLLASPTASGALSASRLRKLQVRALVQLLRQAGEAARLQQLKGLWESAPPAVRAAAAVREAYARGLARVGADAEAAALCVQVLKSEWDPALVALYGTLGGIDPVSQLATAESWLGQHGEKPELLLTAGRACMRNQLWGKARSYLDAAVRAHPTPDVFLALAQLCTDTRNAEEASRFCRRGLELAASRPE